MGKNIPLSKECPKCKGSGKVFLILECRTCGGLGRVIEEKQS